MADKDVKQAGNIPPKVEELNNEDLDQVQGGGVLKGDVIFGRKDSGYVSGELETGDNALKSMGDDGTAKFAESGKKAEG